MLAANSLEGRTAPFITRIENLKKAAEVLQQKYQEDMGAIREDIKEVLAEAKEDGIPKNEMKCLLKHRDLGRKQIKLADSLNGNERDTYLQLVSALGDVTDSE